MNKLYRDTVTLYHADAAAQTVVRTVLRGVCWQQGRRELPDAGGTRRGTALLVVIPETTARYGADYTLAPGDRLFPGEGADLGRLVGLCARGGGGCGAGAVRAADAAAR